MPCSIITNNFSTINNNLAFAAVWYGEEQGLLQRGLTNHFVFHVNYIKNSQFKAA